MNLYRPLARFLAAHPRITSWLLNRAVRTPYTHILAPDGQEVYMSRWWLFNPYDQATRKAKYPWIPFSIRFHHIMQPDSDRHLHDHPWDAQTMVIRGWYLEEREGSRKLIMRNAGDTASLKFGEFHRIHYVGDGGVLTLFVTFKYGGTWGFKVNGKKVPWREYLNSREPQ